MGACKFWEFAELFDSDTLDMKEKILKSKSFAEIGRLLGYNYYNANVKKKF